MLFSDGCNIVLNRAVQVRDSNYQVLTGTGFEWTKLYNGDDIPDHAYVAGQDNRKPKVTKPLYAGRCDYDGELILGKVEANAKMYFTDGERYIMNRNEPHEILICDESTE